MEGFFSKHPKGECIVDVILDKCKNPPDGDPMWQRVLISYEVDPETLCQFTGLTDKNGKKIWENDIVSNKWCFAYGNSIVRYGEYKDWHMTEKYQCGNLGFYLEHIDERDSANTRKDMMYFAGECEVIGNIFDGGSEKGAEEK